MSYILPIITFFTLVFGACNSNPVVTTSTESPSTDTLIPYLEPAIIALPTPDSLAFGGTLDCRRFQFPGKSLLNSDPKSRYCGYAKSNPSISKEDVFPIIFKPKHSPDSNTLSIDIYGLGKEDGLVSMLRIYKIKPQPGIYQHLKNEVSTSFYFMSDRCSPPHSSYKIDPDEQSYFKVISYDTVQQVLKGRFRMHFILQKANKEGYPKKLFFDDGVVWVKANLIHKAQLLK
jgi:hypothetical protein